MKRSSKVVGPLGGASFVASALRSGGGGHRACGRAQELLFGWLDKRPHATPLVVFFGAVIVGAWLRDP
jgi:hypothetical protein